MDVLDVIRKAIAKFLEKYRSPKNLHEWQLVAYFILSALLDFNGLNLYLNLTFLANYYLQYSVNA